MKKFYTSLITISLLFAHMGHAEESANPPVGVVEEESTGEESENPSLSTTGEQAPDEETTTTSLGAAAEASADTGTNNQIWTTVGWATAVLAVATIGILVVAHHPGSKAPQP